MALFSKKLPIGTYSLETSPPNFPVIKVKQTHSDIIIKYDGNPMDDREADGILFSYDELANAKLSVAIVTADCLPIIFLGKTNGVFVHAGWRGLFQGIHISQIVKEIDPFYCYIGPHICAKHFEVQKEFPLLRDHPDFHLRERGKDYYDLKGLAKNQVKKTFPNITIEASPLCAFQEKELHSYRRDKTAQRNWNIFSV